MVFTIDQYTVSYTAVPADPSDTFGERNKDLFGEPHQIVIKENGEVIRTEKRRIKEMNMEDNAMDWVKHFKAAKIDWTDFDKAVELVINKINLFPKKERRLPNDRFTDSLEKWCSTLCYFHPTWSGYDINPVCKKFSRTFFFQTTERPLRNRIIGAFVDAHK